MAKIPKRIAGVKIPKKMRKRGAGALEMLRHPLVADIVAAGLLAAAAALRDNPKVKAAGRNARKKAGKAAHQVGEGAATLGAVIAAKAQEGADWIHDNYETAAHNGSGWPSFGTSGAAKGKARKTKAKKRAKA